MLDFDDYILPQDDLDWQEVLEEWAWILPQTPFEIWIVNRFADLFIVQDGDESVWMLDTSLGTFQQLAASRDEFVAMVENEENFREWFKVEAVDAMTALGQVPEPGQCYTYQRLPRLGGTFTTDNMAVTDIAVHLGMHGQILEQIKDLPEGTVIHDVRMG